MGWTSWRKTKKDAEKGGLLLSKEHPMWCSYKCIWRKSPGSLWLGAFSPDGTLPTTPLVFWAFQKWQGWHKGWNGVKETESKDTGTAGCQSLGGGPLQEFWILIWSSFTDFKHNMRGMNLFSFSDAVLKIWSRDRAWVMAGKELKMMVWDQRDDSTVKSTSCSCKGCRFGSQHPYT